MSGAESRGAGAGSLQRQDLGKLDITKLSALSPEVISRQATINIGTIGHVAHGKSTVVKAISGVQTVRFKNELERNITIKLERLSDSHLGIFEVRAEEKEENTALEKYKRLSLKTKRSLSPVSDKNTPTNKSKKKKESEEYIIENVLDQRITFGKQYFHVKWQGWSEKHNTWEPVENLQNCPLILSSFIVQQEVKHYFSIEKLKTEISFGDLLDDEQLIRNLDLYEELNIVKLKEQCLLTLLAILNLPHDEESFGPELVQEARRKLQLYVLARKRTKQLMALKEWEQEINKIDLSGKLTIENNVDFAGPPENFSYINQSTPGQGVTIPEDPPIGCDCVMCNCHSKKCCGNQGDFFPYNSKKRLRIGPGVPIYECNKACKCPPECKNRVVQVGRSFRLCIYRTDNGCGWGVRTEQKIRQGQFLCQYVGEVITFEEAEKRGREYDANGLTYLFDLDFNAGENDNAAFAIDAAQQGNISHFINHSCDPNLGVWAVFADCLDPNLPMLALFATCDIEAGEEVCFDYLQKAGDAEVGSGQITGDTAGVVNGISSHSDGAGAAVETNTSTVLSTVVQSPSKKRMEDLNITKRTPCRCGSAKCRKYLF